MHNAQSSGSNETVIKVRLLGLALWALGLAVGCAAKVPLPPPEPPVITWEEKLGWIMRLEDQRMLRDPNPPPQVVLVPATTDRPQIVAPPQPSDLIRLLTDPEARVRRRTALALGRVGLRDAVEPLTRLLADEEFEVRQMAAFSLGLIGDVAARPALLTALKDVEPIVQGRAAEALGTLGDRSDAPAVGAMALAHIQAGALMGLAPDDDAYPLTPAAEAARLGLYALVRLGSYEALAATVLDTAGQPVSTWWPVAYALQRLGDPRAAPALMTLLKTPGRYTAAFAARGLGAVKAQGAAGELRQIVEQRQLHPAVVIQSIRALGALADAAAAPAMIRIVSEVELEHTLRIEAMNALSTIARPESLDLMLDLVSDTSPAIRGAAMRVLARLDPVTFLATLSGLDPDRDWTVRTAQATALGSLSPEQGSARLMMLLQDRDQRVIPTALAALVTSKAPGTDKVLLERLKDDDFVIRAAAANGLAELKVTSAVAPLYEAYRAALGDSTYVARAAMLVAVSRIDPVGARPLLQEALKDRDWAVRVRAADLLREQNVTEPVADSIRPAPGGRPIGQAEWQALIVPAFSPHAFIETDRGTIEI